VAQALSAGRSPARRRSYLALKSPEQLTPEERQAEGYMALPGGMLTSGKGLSTTSGVTMKT
jgi:hypothetical protein